MRDAGHPNGFSVFVVQRHEKMKFAVGLTEIIFTPAEAYFSSAL